MAEDFYSQIYKGNNLVRKLFKNGEQVLKVYKHNTKVYEWIGDTPQEEYTLIEWLQCEPNTYFETNYIPTSATTTELTYDRRKGVDSFVLGGRVATNNKSFGIGHYQIYNTTAKAMYFDFNTRYTKTGLTWDKTTVVKLTPNEYYFNGVKQGNITTYTGDFENSIIINGVKTNGTPSLFNRNYHKYYNLKFWEDDELIHNYKPAIRNADGIVGFYDDVTKQFLPPNLGFCTKPEPTDIYAKFDGNSYFDSELTIASAITTVYAECYIGKKSSSEEVPFGARNSTYCYYPSFNFSNNSVFGNIGGSLKASASTINEYSKYDVTISVSGTSNTRRRGVVEIYENDTEKVYQVNTGSTWTTALNTRPIYIGCLNSGGTVSNKYTQYIKTIRIYNGESLVRDFVFREVDGVVKMYDKVNDKYYDNLGTGQITLVDINKLNV